MARIPPDAAVAAQSDLAPHLSHRENIYLFPEKLEQADFIFLDVTSIIFPISSYPQYQEAINTALSSGFGIALSKDGYLLLEKGNEGNSLATEFYSFMLVEDDEAIPSNIEATFADGIHFLGYDVKQKRNSTLQLQTYWYLERPPPADAEIQLNISQRNGDILKAIQPMTTAWMPMDEWPLDTIVVAEFSDFSLGVNPNSEMNLSLEIMANSDSIPIEEIRSPYSYKTTLAKDGNAINLVNFCLENTVLFDCNLNRYFQIPATIKPVKIPFSDAIDLVGYELNAQSFQPGDEVNLNLYWQKKATFVTNMNVFVHLTNMNPWEIFTQEDQKLWKETYPNGVWEQLEISSSEHKLILPENNLPSGKYMVRIGIYNPVTGDRMFITQADFASDHIELIEIEIRD
jgi:hypothetical protein